MRLHYYATHPVMAYPRGRLVRTYDGVTFEVQDRLGKWHTLNSVNVAALVPLTGRAAKIRFGNP